MFSQAIFERDMFKKIVSLTHVFRYSARLCDNQDVLKVEQFDAEKPEEISTTFVKGGSKEEKNGQEEGKERISIIT